VRSTRVLDVLVTADHGLDPLLAAHGFLRVGPSRLRHTTGM
jgi:hypothetical protein